MHHPVLITKRLRLRPPVKEDATQVQFLRSDKRVNLYVSRPLAKTKDDAKAFIEKVIMGAEKEEMLYWCITLKGDPVMIGSICLWHFSPDGKTAEVGYDLHPDFWGQGLMAEALNTVVNFGSQNLNLTTIKAFTHSKNQASTKLLTRHGFKLQTDVKDSDNVNNVLYSLVKSTF